MLREGCNYFSFWVIFCPFIPLTARKRKLKKKKKQKKAHGDIIIYICVPKIMIRSCAVPEIWCMTDVIVISHFGLFFALLLPNQNFEKIKTTPGDIIILHMCTKNYDQMMYGS